jgi:hypothetical protein
LRRGERQKCKGTKYFKKAKPKENREGEAKGKRKGKMESKGKTQGEIPTAKVVTRATATIQVIWIVQGTRYFNAAIIIQLPQVKC